MIEDDAQNGPDHVDAHRVGGAGHLPYTKRKYVDSTLYSTTSMLRTMELILGLAADEPVRRGRPADVQLVHREAEPDGLQARSAEGDLNEKNQPGGFGAAWMEKQNLAKEDTPTTCCSTR